MTVKLHGDAYDEAWNRISGKGPDEMAAEYDVCLTAHERTTRHHSDAQWAEWEAGVPLRLAEQELAAQGATPEEAAEKAFRVALRSIIGGSLSAGVHLGLALAQVQAERAVPDDAFPELSHVEQTVLAQCLDGPLRLGETQFAAAEALERAGLVSSGVRGGQAAVLATERGREYVRRSREGEEGR